MSYHQVDYDRFKKADDDRKMKAMVYELLHPDLPPLPTDEFYTDGEIPEVDPIPTLQWWRLCGSGKKIEGHTFGEPSRSVEMYPEGRKTRLRLSPSIDTTALAEGSWVTCTNCNRSVYRLGVPRAAVIQCSVEEDPYKRDEMGDESALRMICKLKSFGGEDPDSLYHRALQL